MDIDFNKIKLVIWDLDDTFWKGTLSEGGVEECKNTQLVEILAKRGVISAICSKNDKEPVERKLKDLGVLYYFVFNSIDWNPKGPRISTMLKDMGLRSVNVLFIDDNPLNLNEAAHYNPELMVAGPSVISSLWAYFSSLPITDSECKRLNQYKILEKKQESRKVATDNLAFLHSTNTQVEIHTDCVNQIARIHELILRTNQLNYTKNRCSLEELKAQLNAEGNEAGYVTVKDNFGEYGIVGFYLKCGNKLKHFLFSCRTIGQGVEQYVYSQIGFPELDVVGNVVTMLDKSTTPDWINENCDETPKQDYSRSSEGEGKVIFKGPCDMSILVSYLDAKNVVTEFTYTSKTRHNYIEHHNHSINFLLFHDLTTVEKEELLTDCVFNDEEIFSTAIFDDDVRLIFISSQIEPNLGVYRNKKTGKRIAFGEYCYPLTDSSFWPLYVEKKVPTLDNEFTQQWLQEFAEKYVFVGRIDADEYIKNLEELLGLISPDAKICVLLGSEIPYEKNTLKAYEKREEDYKLYNAKLRELAARNDRILLICFSDYIQGQKDFLDNINHYQRHVYYDAAIKANDYIAACTGKKLASKGRFTLFLDDIASKFRYADKKNNIVLKYLRMLYHKLR